MINFKKFTTKLKFSINFECMKPKFLKNFRNPNKKFNFRKFFYKIKFIFIFTKTFFFTKIVYFINKLKIN